MDIGIDGPDPARSQAATRLKRGRVEIRPAARRDLIAHYRWLETEAGTDIADRFLSAAGRSFTLLAATSGLGPVVGSDRRKTAKLRKWHVDGFAEMLIFYEPSRDGIRVLRVMHGSSDWSALFDR